MRYRTRWFALPLAVVLLGMGSLSHAQSPLLVVGHMNPDTDSICSAIAVAQLKNAQGVPAQAGRQGAVPADARRVLERFKLPEPVLVSNVAGRRVFLVDHTDASQAPAGLQQAELVGFVDHHKLGGLTTDKPYEAWAAPVGATGTLVVRMYDQARQVIPRGVAGCLLATILTDTVIFKSATTTSEDRKMAERLARIAGVTDLQAFGRDLLQAKSNIQGQSAMELLKRDFKDFDMKGRKVAVAQLELLDLSAVTPLQAELLAAMRTLKQQAGYHSVFLMLTDTTQQATNLLFVSDAPEVVDRAWQRQAQGPALWLPGVMSRKSQIIPPLQRAFD